MHRLLFSLSTLLCLLIQDSSALAYGPCDEDAEKLCQGEFHHETERNCLHKKVEQLSAACKSFVMSKDEEWQKFSGSWVKVKAACAEEIGKACPARKEKTEELIKATQVCLMMSSETLGANCKADLNRHIKEHQPHLNPIK